MPATTTVEPDPVALRRTRREMLAAYAARHGYGDLAPRTIRLAGLDAVQVDGANADESVIVEVDTHPDAGAEGLRARIGQALLTLSLVRRERPQSTLVLLVANEEVRRAVARWVPGLGAGHPIRLDVPA